MKCLFWSLKNFISALEGNRGHAVRIGRVVEVLHNGVAFMRDHLFAPGCGEAKGTFFTPNDEVSHLAHSWTKVRPTVCIGFVQRTLIAVGKLRSLDQILLVAGFLATVAYNPIARFRRFASRFLSFAGDDGDYHFPAPSRPRTHAPALSGNTNALFRFVLGKQGEHVTCRHLLLWHRAPNVGGRENDNAQNA